MKLEQVRPGIITVTAHVYELAALTAAARYLAESAPDDVPAELLDQLRRVLDDYDRQTARIRAARTMPET